jgi:hypothetical protein
MRKACQYAIIRFMPFIETGEFANVGIVLLCPEQRFLDFRLLGRQDRIIRFFEGMDERVYTEAMKFLDEELSRVHSALGSSLFDGRQRQNDIQAAPALFRELVRPREGIMRFDAPRAVLADDPRAKLDELYGFYVERDFATAA